VRPAEETIGVPFKDRNTEQNAIEVAEAKPMRSSLLSILAVSFLATGLGWSGAVAQAATISFLDFHPGVSTTGAQYKSGEPDLDGKTVATTVTFQDTIDGETFDIDIEFEAFSDAFTTTGKIEVEGANARFGVDTAPPSSNDQNLGANASEEEGFQMTWISSTWVSGAGVKKGLQFDGWKEIQLTATGTHAWNNDDTVEIDGTKYNANNHASAVLAAADSSSDSVLDVKALVAEEGDGSPGGTETKFKIDGFAANVTPVAGIVSVSGWTDVETALATTGDYFGTVVTAVANTESGTNASGSFSGNGQHTNIDGDDTIGWAVGDYVLEGNYSAAQEPDVDDVLAKMELTIPAGKTDIDLMLSFTLDREGTLEADDSLRFEIYDVTNSLVLTSLTLADDADFPVGDTLTILTSSDHTGLTDVEARIIYAGGGWSGGDQEEIQIGNPVFTATYVPEPSALALSALGLFGLSAWGRRRRR